LEQFFRDNIRDVDINKLCEQYRGAEYRKLVEQHIRKLGDKLEMAITAAIQACTDTERKVGEYLIDEYNQKGYEKSFWRRDCADVLMDICNQFEQLMSEYGERVEEKGKFNMFNLITMNLAAQARDQKVLRKFAGIRISLLFR